MDYKLAIEKNLKKSNGRKLVLWSCGILKKYLLENFRDMKINVDSIVEKGIDEVEGGTKRKFYICGIIFRS